MNGFTAKCILACWPKLDFVVNLAPHCPQICGLLSSNDELRRLRGFGGETVVVCGDSAAFVVAEIPPAVPAAFVVDVGVIRETVVAGDLVVIIVDGVNRKAGGSEGLNNILFILLFGFCIFMINIFNGKSKYFRVKKLYLQGNNFI